MVRNTTPAWHARGRRFDPAWLHHQYPILQRPKQSRNTRQELRQEGVTSRNRFYVVREGAECVDSIDSERCTGRSPPSATCISIGAANVIAHMALRSTPR